MAGPTRNANEIRCCGIWVSLYVGRKNQRVVIGRRFDFDQRRKVSHLPSSFLPLLPSQRLYIYTTHHHNFSSNNPHYTNSHFSLKSKRSRLHQHQLRSVLHQSPLQILFFWWVLCPIFWNLLLIVCWVVVAYFIFEFFWLFWCKLCLDSIDNLKFELCAGGSTGCIDFSCKDGVSMYCTVFGLILVERLRSWA